MFISYNKYPFLALADNSRIEGIDISSLVNNNSRSVDIVFSRFESVAKRGKLEPYTSITDTDPMLVYITEGVLLSSVLNKRFIEKYINAVSNIFFLFLLEEKIEDLLEIAKRVGLKMETQEDGGILFDMFSFLLEERPDTLRLDKMTVKGGKVLLDRRSLSLLISIKSVIPLRKLSQSNFQIRKEIWEKVKIITSPPRQSPPCLKNIEEALERGERPSREAVETYISFRLFTGVPGPSVAMKFRKEERREIIQIIKGFLKDKNQRVIPYNCSFLKEKGLCVYDCVVNEKPAKNPIQVYFS